MYKLRNNILKEIVKEYNLGDIKLIDRFKDTKNNTYKIITDKSTFVVKEYSKDVISNYYYLKKRKEQIRINKILILNHIPCLYPININEKNFTKLNDNYYLVYNYIEDQPITVKYLTTKHIKKLAQTQAKIHNLNITSSLPCIYKKLNFNTSQYTRKIKSIDISLYDNLINNKELIKEIVYKCNRCINSVKKNLVISHCEYHLDNILWNDDKMTIIDYDKTAKINPTAIMAESAFRFSYNNKKINFDFYKEYIKTYNKKIEKNSDNFKEAIYASYYGLIIELQKILNDICTSKNKDKRANNLIDEIITYHENMNKLCEIYYEK